VKYFVEVAAPADKGALIDAAGGPGPIVGELSQRFHPEAFYGSVDARTLRFVVELPTALDIAILMEICSDRLYAYPTFHPVIPIAEMPEFVGAVHAAIPHASPAVNTR
jgi:hypothetical protein